MELPPDLRSSSDADLVGLIGNCSRKRRRFRASAVSCTSTSTCLASGVSVQTTGVPLDGWAGRLVARENEVSYERSLLQGHLDILRAERKERRNGRSLARRASSSWPRRCHGTVGDLRRGSID